MMCSIASSTLTFSFRAQTPASVSSGLKPQLFTRRCDTSETSRVAPRELLQ